MSLLTSYARNIFLPPSLSKNRLSEAVMSVRARNHASALRAGGFAQAVLMYLADCHNDETGRCNPSRESIREFFSSEDEPCTLKRVDLDLARLRELGFIESKKVANGTGVVNWYSFPGLGNVAGLSHPDQMDLVAPILGDTPKTGVTPKMGASPQNGIGVAPKMGSTGSPHCGGCNRKLNRKEQEINITRAEKIDFYGLPDDLVSDWRKHRKVKKAVLTQRVVDGFKREAEAAGITLAQAVQTSIQRGWTGFDAKWINRGRNPQTKRFNDDYYKDSINADGTVNYGI